MADLAVSPDPPRAPARFTWRPEDLRRMAADASTGAIAAFVLLANIVSFAALMFPGDLAVGFPVAIWSLLIGSAVGGVVISLTTSLPPISSGIDSPTGAVLVLISGMAAQLVSARSGTPADAVPAILLVYSAATVTTGAFLYALGAWRLGPYLRFVPYFVVGGFLTATGWFLIVGGLRMTTGHDLASAGGLSTPWTASEVLRLAVTLGVLTVLLNLKRMSKSPFAVPAALVVMWVLISGGLVLSGTGRGSGWFFATLGPLTGWNPWSALSRSGSLAPVLVQLLPEVISVALVALISLVTKVSSIEVSRNATADLDRELRGHGLAALAAAPFGGTLACVQIGTSKLLEQPGRTARASGIAAAGILGLVAIFSLDVQSIVPTVLIGGLVLFLGVTFLVEALSRPIAQRAWFDVALSVIIAVCCVKFGFLAGILIGVVTACLMFAFNYARIGVVRRHATRAQFASNVDRSDVHMRHLATAGSAVQIYWLSGYIFFGSAERLFERIRGDLEGFSRDGAFVVLDFAGVPGADSSAVLSLVKLRNHCDPRGITMVVTGLPARSVRALEDRKLFGTTSRHKLFADFDAGLAHCEEELLARSGLTATPDRATFAQWLVGQLGQPGDSIDVFGYLELNRVEGRRQLYRQGDPANSIDLVAAGDLVVHVAAQRGRDLCIRRFTTHTVVGEMGFFRKGLRSASISTDGPATLYTLTRANFERMRRERPDLALAFDDFIIRTLSDRLEFANRAVDALSR